MSIVVPALLTLRNGTKAHWRILNCRAKCHHEYVRSINVCSGWGDPSPIRSPSPSRRHACVMRRGARTPPPPVIDPPAAGSRASSRRRQRRQSTVCATSSRRRRGWLRRRRRGDQLSSVWHTADRDVMTCAPTTRTRGAGAGPGPAPWGGPERTTRYFTTTSLFLDDSSLCTYWMCRRSMLMSCVTCM